MGSDALMFLFLAVSLAGLIGLPLLALAIATVLFTDPEDDPRHPDYHPCRRRCRHPGACPCRYA